MSATSDISTLQRESYSAKVTMFLRVQDRRLNIGRIRHDVMTLRETCDVPAGSSGVVELSINGETEYTAIVLHRGITAGIDVVEYQRTQ